MKWFICAVFSLLLAAMSAVHADPDVYDSLLGGTVDQGRTWYDTADSYWREAGSGPVSGNNIDGNNGNYVGWDGSFHDTGLATWRVSKTVTVAGRVDLMVMPHIRSGTPSGCHGRLYNKVRIVRALPTRSENLALNSEALIELASGCLRYFDASRTVIATDFNPVVGQQNVYAVEVVAGDGTHTEISFGSLFRILNP